MLGLYDRTPRRNKVMLDGWWDFCLDPQDEGEGAGYVSRFPACRRIMVPGCWNTEFGMHYYQGAAWYRTVFSSPFAGRARLTFGAVADVARVWLNGDYLGEHEGGFTAFDWIVDVQAGDNDLVVRVDNRHSDKTLPKEGVDWFPYGGISRSVTCEQVGQAWIDRVHVRGALDGTVEVQVFCRSQAASPLILPLTVQVGEQKAQAQVVLEEGEQVATLHIKIADPVPWSTDTPHLYLAVVQLGEDVYQVRLGLREIRVEGKNILLNGRPIWIRGVNRHEDHPDWGFALPPKLMQRDIDIIHDLGCNAVRGSHYPNHPAFLDMCDEAGLLFFAEVPGWQYSAAQIATSPTREKLQHTLREMIDQQFNHPSIVIWSLHNECETEVDRQGEVDLSAAMAELTGLARRLDETRLVTYASHRFWHDKHLALADVICLNEYIGWYVDQVEGLDFAGYLQRMAELYPDKPILITEFGAGGIPGYHSMAALKWSEEYQAQHVRGSIETMLENDHVAGCYIWQYCDIVTHPLRALGRPRSLNNKGLVDEYRQPKLGYFVVKDLFAHVARLHPDTEV